MPVTINSGLWKTLLCAFFVVAILQQARADELLSEAEFSERYVQAVRAAYPDIVIDSISGLEIRYHRAGDQDHSLAELSNAYTRYRNQPDQLQVVLKDYVRAAKLITAKAACSPQAILPSIKDQRYVEGIRKLLADNAAEHPDKPAAQATPVIEPLVGALYIVYVIDTPDATRTITSKDLSDCHLDAQGLHQHASENLAVKAADFAAEPVNGIAGVMMVRGDGYYETAMLLNDQFWSRYASKLRGDVVAAVPARGLLLFTGREDQAGVALLARLAASVYAREAYPIWAGLLVRHDQRWQVYNP